MTKHDWELLRKQIGPRIWDHWDLAKAFGFGLFLGLLFMSPLALADQLVHKFKNPSFSGVGTSAHYLTIENQEKSRRDKIQEDIDAALREAEREAENSVLAKFIRNLESRIYSQLSKQLVDALFNGEGSTFGSFVLEGNTITYEVTPCDANSMACTDGEDVIIMKIVDENGSETIITIPVGVGTFGG